MKRARVLSWGWGALALGSLSAAALLGVGRQPGWHASDSIALNAIGMLAEGRQTFRYDTFGDETFWGGTLRLHETVAQLSPVQALELGLKVDIFDLSPGIARALRQGQLNLNDPAVTLTLLKHNAVVGVRGFFDGNELTSIGITCSLCHATVDNSVAAGVGRRLDGWPNRDLNVGGIIASAPDLSVLSALTGHPVEAIRTTLQNWGRGKFDAEFLLDGRVQGPNGSAATLIPPAFGMAGVNEHTWTAGWGTTTYWNALVANIEMQGQGRFYDPRLNNAAQFPVAAAAGFGDIRDPTDRITPKLAGLQFYQLAIPAPRAPHGSFNAAAANRGKALFNSPTVDCARCHTPPLFTEPGYNTHAASEIGIDDFQANRSPDRRYRTPPLKGLWAHQTGGFYHDGRFPTLLDVVNHYNATFNLNLSPQQKSDLVQYLLSI